MKAFLSVSLLLAAISEATFRFTRPLETAAGWSILTLPDDVLDACRPGLPDVRVTDAAGRDVAYAFASSAGGEALRFELVNVESVAGKETTALLDRGEHPPLARSAELEITESEFLKPVTLEASQDSHSYRETARGSLFATSELRSTRLRFPPNDRRFWRFRFDDRNGAPINPVAVRVEAAGEPPATREISLPTLLSAGEDASIVTTHLPAANLGVTALRLSIHEPAYERRVRVFERVFFRDEILRRLVGSATIRRSPDTAADAEIAICDLTGRNVVIEIENGDSPPLRVLGLTARAQPPQLLFFSAGGPLNLIYGSSSAAWPRYDLAAALRGGRPTALTTATLGPARQLGAPAPVAAPPRGAPLDVTAWKTHQPIVLPASGTIAYLDLQEPLARQVASLRIVDSENRPVPYAVEQSVRRVTRSLLPRVRQNGTRTLVEISGLDPSQPADALRLFASAPEYFSRGLTVLEEERDARGITGHRMLGTARWDRRPGERPHPVDIPVAPPRTNSLRVEIENGDNAPLQIDRVEIQTPFVRIDFVFAPGERLSLLSDNPQASSPPYDFAMIADRVLAAPARAARLGPSTTTREQVCLPKWFWVAVAGGALLVGLALVRTLRDVRSGTER